MFWVQQLRVHDDIILANVIQVGSQAPSDMVGISRQQGVD